MTARSTVLSDLLSQPRISADDVLRVRSVIYPDGGISPEEVEALFALNEDGASKSPEWRMLFVEAITDYLVMQQHPQGYVDKANGDWLTARIVKDGRVQSDTELELLIHVLETATEAPASLQALEHSPPKLTHIRRGGSSWRIPRQ